MSADLLPILYQDQWLVAVNKPVDLLVHKSDIDRYEKRNAMKLLRDQLGVKVFPLHRLDRATSGSLLFALDREMAIKMNSSFVEGQVSKRYLAVLRGYTEEKGRIDHPLEKLWDRMTDSKADRTIKPQNATTDFRRLGTAELPFAVGRYSTARYSLVEARPLTGRNHQIRRHFKHISHPIIGDTSHGDGKHNLFFREHLHCRRMLLHASRISFFHPHLQEEIVIESALEGDFLDLLQNLRIPIKPAQLS